MSKVVLNNSGPVDAGHDIYFPRLQVNKRGEIVLATGKDGFLTTGILVGKTKESKSEVPIGKKFTDWEVCGELTDYDGEVTVTFQNWQKV
jgi:hypothetical protein